MHTIETTINSAGAPVVTVSTAVSRIDLELRPGGWLPIYSIAGPGQSTTDLIHGALAHLEAAGPGDYEQTY